MDAAVEVAVAGQHRRGIEVPLDDLLLNGGIQGTGHAVAGGAGKGHDAEAEPLKFLVQSRLFQVEGDCLGSGGQGRLDPGLAHQTEPVGVAGQQARGNHVARVAGVGATGDGGDDDGAIGQEAVRLLGASLVQIHRDTALRQGGDRQAAMGVGGARQGAHHARQVKVQHPLVLGARQADLLVVTAGELEVVEGLLVDEEHGRGSAVFRCHVGDGGPIAEGEGGGALATKLQIGPDYLLLAQEFGERQHQVRGGDAGLRLAGELHADDRRQPHPGGAPQHDVLGL